MESSGQKLRQCCAPMATSLPSSLHFGGHLTYQNTPGRAMLVTPSSFSQPGILVLLPVTLPPTLQTGAWGCFDEFNRINIEVLSVVAQQILSILSALAGGLTRFYFEGFEINLVWSCGIFITMNPGKGQGIDGAQGQRENWGCPGQTTMSCQACVFSQVKYG